VVRTICSSGENQQSSPLLRLLAELRLKIYEYALSDWEVSMTHEPYPPWPFGLRKLRCRRIDTSKGDWIAPANAILGLSLVCRQIRIETLPFGFTLDNKYHWLTTRSKKGMFDRLGEERCKLLQKVSTSGHEQDLSLMRVEQE
jgi:hypothetical protein